MDEFHICHSFLMSRQLTEGVGRMGVGRGVERGEQGQGRLRYILLEWPQCQKMHTQ